MIRKICAIILLLIICLPFKANAFEIDYSYTFDRYVGDTILFYPLNPLYNGEYDRYYSCFYDQKALKSGFKAKYRFHYNKVLNGTDNNEIEGHYFKVLQIVKDDNILKKKKLCYLAELLRIDNGEHLYLALPRYLDKISSTSLTHCFFVNDGGHYYVNIPFRTKKLIDELLSLNNKTVILTKPFSKEKANDYNWYLPIKFANTENKVDTLTSIVKGATFTLKTPQFVSLGTPLVFKQLYMSVYCNNLKSSYNIPITYFVGNANRNIIQHYENNFITEHFKSKEEIISSSSFDGRIPLDLQLDKGKEFYIDAKGFYKLVNIDFYPLHSLNSYSCLIESRSGHQEIVSIDYMQKNAIPASVKENEIRQKQQEAKANEEHKRLIKRKYPMIYRWILGGDITEEKVKQLYKKYGKSKAESMVMHLPEVGWTRKEVSEAMYGCKLVNHSTYENSYGFYEINTYQIYDNSYTVVTLRNGRVVSVSDVDY